MGDGAAERSLRGLLLVHVNELVVAGGVREGVDAGLVDGDPVGQRDLRADMRGQLIRTDSGGGGHTTPAPPSTAMFWPVM